MRAILLLSLLCALPLWANDVTVKEFIFDGQSYERQRIDFKKTEIIYEEEWVYSTCYKQEPYLVQDCGYKKVTEKHCTTLPPTTHCEPINGKLVCTPISGKRVCRDVTTTKYVCEDVTKYHTVAYSCKKKELVPVETVGKRFITNLFFNFDATPLYAELIVRSEMNREDGSVVVTATNIDGSSVLLVAQKSEKIGGNKDIKVTDLRYQVRVYDREQVLSPVAQRPSDLGFFGTWLMFKVGKVYTPQLTKFKLRIVDIATGRVMINRFLMQGEYRIRTGFYDDLSRVTVELRNLGLSFSSWRKYRFKITSQVDFGEGFEVLNTKNEIGTLSSSKIQVLER